MQSCHVKIKIISLFHTSIQKVLVTAEGNVKLPEDDLSLLNFSTLLFHRLYPSRRNNLIAST